MNVDEGRGEREEGRKRDVASIELLVKGWGVLLGIPALFVIAYLYPLFPALDRLEICAVKRFLGFDCPGCGLTRSFALLAHGHIRASIDMHPLGILIVIWFVYLFARTAAMVVARRKFAEILTQQERDVLVGAFVLALLLQWVAKFVIS